MGKRKRPDPKSSVGNLNEHEKLLLDLIRSKKGSGATKSEMRGIFKAGPPPPGMITELVKTLENNKLIKEVPKKNGVKHFRAMEFVPKKELTDGGWYINGTLDLSRIEDLKEKCILILKRQRHIHVTLDVLSAKFFKEDKLSVDHTKEILNNLILDNNMIMEVKTTGIGDSCYKLTGKKSEVRAGAFASVPCGTCPNIGICTPDGAISPSTCVPFHKWLDF